MSMMTEDLATKLASIAELAELEEDRDDDVWVRPAPPRDPSQVYSVRIPLPELEKLRRVAEHRGVTPSALMRSWVLIRLDAEYEAMLGICPRCGQPAGPAVAVAVAVAVARIGQATRARAAAGKAGPARAAAAVKKPAVARKTAVKAAAAKNPPKKAAPKKRSGS